MNRKMTKKNKMIWRLKEKINSKEIQNNNNS